MAKDKTRSKLGPGKERVKVHIIPRNTTLYHSSRERCVTKIKHNSKEIHLSKACEVGRKSAGGPVSDSITDSQDIDIFSGIETFCIKLSH